MTPEFMQGPTPSRPCSRQKEKTEATPEDATKKIGKVIWHETTEQAQIVPVLICGPVPNQEGCTVPLRPNALTSEKYAKELNEVKKVGSATLAPPDV